ncbi:MAG: glycosyltransferase family 4 protein [Arcobacter sp.]|nr:glycosyltransferase family 4 protein [Arcobacter sp.]
MKKILIDLTQIPIKKVGVGVYAENLIRELIVSSNKIKYKLLIQDDDLEFIKLIKELNKNDEVIIKEVNSNIFRKFIFRFVLEQIYIPLYASLNKVDVIHSLHYTFPLFTNKKRVVTYHDMTFFIYPELHEKIKVIIFKFFIKLGIKKCNKIISVSQSTKNDLKKYLKLGDKELNKIKVIPLGKSDLYNLERNENDIDEIKNKFLISKEYILFIGTLEPRKNIERILEAFNDIKNKINEELVIVGKKGWFYDKIYEKLEKYELQDRVVLTGYVTEEEKVSLLKGAKLFVYPSFYEGFGIPVLEALSCGIPTITSNISSLPEVAGKAAELINPNDIDEISKSILEMLVGEEKRNNFIKLGIDQSNKFSWKRCALETKKIYEEL